MVASPSRALIRRLRFAFTSCHVTIVLITAGPFECPPADDLNGFDQKLMALMNPKNKEEEEEDFCQMQTDVTDEEMALRYRRTTETPAPAFTFD